MKFHFDYVTPRYYDALPGTSTQLYSIYIFFIQQTFFFYFLCTNDDAMIAAKLFTRSLFASDSFSNRKRYNNSFKSRIRCTQKILCCTVKADTSFLIKFKIILCNIFLIKVFIFYLFPMLINNYFL